MYPEAILKNQKLFVLNLGQNKRAITMFGQEDGAMRHLKRKLVQLCDEQSTSTVL